MIWNSARVFLVLSICCFVAASSDRPVDCRKFVFAPLCRGVAAKRGPSDLHGRNSPTVYFTSKSFRDFLKNAYPEPVIPRGDDEDGDDNLLKRLYQKQRQEDNVYKLFQESKRSGSGESENTISVPVHEYENL